MAGTEGKQDRMQVFIYNSWILDWITQDVFYGFLFEKHASDFSTVYGLNVGHVKYGCLEMLSICNWSRLMAVNVTEYCYCIFLLLHREKP